MITHSFTVSTLTVWWCSWLRTISLLIQKSQCKLISSELIFVTLQWVSGSRAGGRLTTPVLATRDTGDTGAAWPVRPWDRAGTSSAGQVETMVQHRQWSSLPGTSIGSLSWAGPRHHPTMSGHSHQNIDITSQKILFYLMVNIIQHNISWMNSRR